jgi:dihydroxyacetone kinase phosphotransfer subunit
MTDRPRVGLVVVSHVRAIATGTAELAHAMAASVRVVPAGGLDDGSLGTDALAVADAMRAADEGAGVVVLVDLGSAVLAAQTALELLGDEAVHVRLSGGPLVEGAVIGAVQAQIGSSLDEVLAATEAARDVPKGGHLPG